MTLVLLIVLFAIVTILVFSSSKISPIPYFPTLSVDFEAIKKALNLKNGHVLFDLGAGDGKIIFSFSDKNIKTVGVEINPYLVLVMKIRWLFYFNRKNVQILWQSLFKTNIKQASHIYLFVGPYLIDSICSFVLKNKGKGLQKVVSYRYPPKKTHRIYKLAKVREVAASHPIYIWDFKTSSSRP
jgi:hypothetical protein